MSERIGRTCRLKSTGAEAGVAAGAKVASASKQIGTWQLLNVSLLYRARIVHRCYTRLTSDPLRLRGEIEEVVGKHTESPATVVLAVEDDDSAYHLLKLAFREANNDAILLRTVDGQQALDFLRRRTPFENAPRPDLVLLNLNLPKLNGIEVLEIIKADALLNEIPVVVFTSSALDEDRARCLALGARDFVTKPLDFERLIVAVKCAHAFVRA